MTDKMEMPDVIYARHEGTWTLVKLIDWPEQYHHSRIVEALRRENDELKAKLDKANNTGEIITATLNDLQAAFSKLCAKHADVLGDLQKSKDCLEQISRMKTFPDNAINTTTLVAAHTIARTTLEEIE